tara:strand:+ start:510 stop:683 length:174 start_codon:yes stop_codon:yes gene_type:complete
MNATGTDMNRECARVISRVGELEEEDDIVLIWAKVEEATVRGGWNSEARPKGEICRG